MRFVSRGIGCLVVAGLAFAPPVLAHHTGRPHRHAGAAEIRDAQQKLKDAGFDPGSIDGKMGRHTREAVRSYQERNQLQATGRLDHETLSALGVETTGATSGTRGGTSAAPRSETGTSGTRGAGTGTEGMRGASPSDTGAK
jgi:peptidoglycan hydrolase-like protein with peptidoglycan-binding domain